MHPYATIGDDVVIGEGTTIFPGVHVLRGVRSANRSPSIPTWSCTRERGSGIGAGFTRGRYWGRSGSAIARKRDVTNSRPNSATSTSADDVEIGAGATIDRGTYGPNLVGEGTKIDNLVMIAHNCRIGRHNLLCSQAAIAGSRSTGDGVVMAGQVGVRDHVHIGQGAVLCSKAGVSNDVPAGAVMLGQPATPLRQQKLQMAPWPNSPRCGGSFAPSSAGGPAVRRLDPKIRKPTRGHDSGHRDVLA